MNDDPREQPEPTRLSSGRHPLIHSRSFRAFFVADLCVTVAERYFVLTFTWWLLSQAGGATRLALLMAVQSVPTLVVGFLLGPVIDGADKRRLMLASVLAQTVVAGGVALLFVSGQLTFTSLCVASFLLGCLLPAFEASANAALPEVVAEDQLLAAAAVQTSTLEMSNIVAAAMAFGTLAVAGFIGAVVVDVALYVTGAAFLLRVKLARRPHPGERGPYFADLRDGVRHLLGERGLAAFVCLYVIKLLFTAPLLVLIPMLVRQRLGDAPGWAGILETAFSVGSIATAAWLSFRPPPRGLYRWYAVGLALLGALMLALPRAMHPGWMLPAVIVMGCAVAALMALSSVLFQGTVSNDYKGRFFGLLETLAAGMIPAGYGLMGVVSRSAGVDGVLLASGAGLLCLSGLALVIPRVRWR